MSAKQSETELARLLASVTPFFEKYGNHVILGLAAVLLLTAGGIYWAKQSPGSAAGWAEMSTNNGAEDFAETAKKYAGTDVGAWARLAEADGYLARGIEMSFVDRAAATKESGPLALAQKAYKSLDKGSSPETVRERALFGLARHAEATSDGDTGAAVAAYRELVKRYPDTIYKERAEERVAQLEDDSTKGFYAWFHSQNPAPGDDTWDPQDGGKPPETPEPGDVSLDGLPKPLIGGDSSGIAPLTDGNTDGAGDKQPDFSVIEDALKGDDDATGDDKSTSEAGGTTDDDAGTSETEKADDSAGGDGAEAAGAGAGSTGGEDSGK